MLALPRRGRLKHMRTIYPERGYWSWPNSWEVLCGGGRRDGARDPSVVEADLASAEQVNDGHNQIAALGAAQKRVPLVLRLQQPVAGEPRSIVSWIQVVATRIGWAHWPACGQDR